MTEVHSLKGRLLRRLIGSLTLLLAIGFAGLFVLQSRLLVGEFDRRVFEMSGRVMREVSRHGTENVEMPEGLLLIEMLDSDTENLQWAAPAGSAMTLEELGLGQPMSDDQSLRYDTTLADGTSARIFMRKFGRRQDRRENRSDTEKDTQEILPPPPPPQQDNQQGSQLDQGEKPERKRDGRFRHRRQPPGIFVVVADRQELNTKISTWMTILLISCAAGEFLVIMAVLSAVRRGLASLDLAAEEISSIDSGSLSSRVSTRAIASEMQPVVSQVNSLLERLEAAFDREQAFTANAAHELRTPLAGMRTQLEVLLRRNRDTQEYQQNAENTLQTVKSMHAMVDAMLELARLDSKRKSADSQQIELHSFIESLCSQHTSVAESHGCRFVLAEGGAVNIKSDVSLLETVLGNLLSNAADYCDPGGSIEVDITQAEEFVYVSVSNPAEELTGEDVSNIFDRLWRKDTARTDAASHCGLGLSIAKRCCELLGAKITASTVGGVVSFKVELPV